MAKTGLASLSEGRSDIYKVDPRSLHIKANWNSRDLNAAENVEHIDQLAQSIAEIGVKQPLTVYWEDGKAYIADGHCRLMAAIRAIEVYKADLKTIPVKAGDQHANEADRICGQIVYNSGKPFAALEQAKVFKKLIDLGWQQDDIAKRVGLSNGRISQILDILTLPEGVKSMVKKGEVSASMAMKVVKTAPNGTAAEQALKQGLVAAKADGSDKVKSVHMAKTTVRTTNIRALVIDAFEYADIDDSAEDLCVIKLPMDKWDAIKDALKL